jgi:hypothetical protein
LWERWAAFADSSERMDRLRGLVEHAHAFGIAAGVDVPIAFEQQHSFRLLRSKGALEEELAEIRTRLGLVMQGKFDFLGSEAYSCFSGIDARSWRTSGSSSPSRVAQAFACSSTAVEPGKKIPVGTGNAEE